MSDRLLNRFVLKVAVTLASVAPLFFAQVACGQTNALSPRYLPNRFLVVVETSRGMQRRSKAMVRAVQELLNSAIAAQAHRGDTLGIWTYNEDLSTGVLPLQQWSPETREAISTRVVEFLQAQKFEKRANLEKVVSALDRINKNSQFITVILICLGDANIQGTPFDSRINQFFQTWRVQQQDAGTPFVIALRGQGGVFVDCSMNPSPWPPELPALPRELVTPIKPALDTQVHRPATSTVPNLIVSGKKRDAVTTNSTTQSLSSPLQPAAAPAINSTPAVPSPNIASAAAVAVVTAAPITSAPPGTSSPSLNPAATDNRPAVAAPVTSSVPTQLATTNPRDSSSPALSGPTAPALAQPLAKPEAAVEQKLTAQATPAQSEPAPQLKAQNEGAGEPRVAATPLETATAHVPPGHTNYLVLGVTAFVSVSALVGAVILWRARRRTISDTSLITESFDRRKE